jgi:DNA primase
MAYIPEDKLLEIKDAAPIEAVVGQYVKLTQKGRNLLGLCPFHSETKPSFTVAPDKGIFHCFGCGAGGNVFAFLMQYHRISFPEAAEELARRYGITLTLRDLGPEGAKASRKRQAWQELLNQAAAFYRQTLEGPAGPPARDYLARRGLTPEVILEFQLGYAPGEWDALRKHLQNKGLSLDLAQEIGLLMPRPSGGYYDRFRDRVMFPIADRTGRVVAFGGRVLGEGEPKYLNSPESPLYSKGRLLYGLPQASAALRRQDLALVVEGYLDLLALRVHGIEPVLATLGTALTREQVRLLKSLVSRVVLVFDGDAAGAAAMRRAFPLFAEAGLAVRALPLPAGMDPDNYVNAHGPELFQAPWENAQPMFAFLLEGLIQTHGLDIEGRVRLLSEMRPYFQALRDPVEQSLWLKFTAERLDIEEGGLRSSLRVSLPSQAARVELPTNLAINLEKQLLKWILCQPEMVDWDELEEWLHFIVDANLRKIITLALAIYRENGALDLGLLTQNIEEEQQRQQVCAMALAGEAFSQSNGAQLLADYRRAFHTRRLQQQQKEIKEKLAQAAAGLSGEDILDLQARKREIDNQLEALKAGR